MSTIKLPQELSSRMNVSAQPKISPFRYPGGKTRLAELVHLWINSQSNVETFIEPFAGGASVALYVASHSLAKRVRFIELDEDVASVWQTILSNDVNWLCRRILDFSPTRRGVMDVLGNNSSSTKNRAFKTLVRNRVGRSGLLWNGAGIVRSGERGAGLASRWYPSTLVSRIMHIHSLRSKIKFQHGCGLEELRSRCENPRNIFFVDPPYTADDTSAGKRLYRHNEIDHGLLFDLLASSKSKFLMTHENDPKIRKLARTSGMQTFKLPVLTAQNKKDTELLIGFQLSRLINTLWKGRSNLEFHISKLDFIED